MALFGVLAMGLGDPVLAWVLWACTVSIFLQELLDHGLHMQLKAHE